MMISSMNKNIASINLSNPNLCHQLLFDQNWELLTKQSMPLIIECIVEWREVVVDYLNP